MGIGTTAKQELSKGTYPETSQLVLNSAQLSQEMTREKHYTLASARLFWPSSGWLNMSEIQFIFIFD